MADKTTTLNVQGMTCQHCVMAVHNHLAQLPGVKDVKVDLAGKKAQVTYDEGKVGVDQFKKAVSDAGYQVV